MTTQLNEAGQKLADAPVGAGIYIASKTAHAAKWRSFRADGAPIISTWIDEAGVGETACFADLWRRCVSEAAGARALVVYREPGEVLKGAFVEVGAALAAGKPVFAVGCDEFSFVNHAGVTLCETVYDAVRQATAAQILLTPEGGGMRGPMSDYTRFALLRLARCAEAAVATDGKCASEWLTEDAENARSNDPEVGIFGNEDMACLFEALDGLVEAVGPMGTTIARELLDLASLAPKTSVPGNDAGMREALVWPSGGLTNGPAALSPPTGSAGDDETGMRAGDDKLWWFLKVLQSAGGTAYANGDRWDWANAFCDDRGEGTDTFNLADEADLTAVSHDSDTGNSTVYITQAGRQYIAPQPPKAETPAVVAPPERIAQALMAADWSGVSIGNKLLISSAAVALSLAPAARSGDGVERALRLARVSVANSVESYRPWVEKIASRVNPWQGTLDAVDEALAALAAAPAANGKGVERRKMAEGCCSASSPCGHQKRDPYSICEVCQKAADITDARTAASAANGEGA